MSPPGALNREKKMSKYYQISNKKIRVSDHEPNFSLDFLRGKNDVELYTVDACGAKLDIQAQISNLYEKGILDESDLIEMNKKGLATKATLRELDIKTSKRESFLASQKKLVDSWFKNGDKNSLLLKELKENPGAFASYKFTSSQKESWIKYVQMKFNKIGW